MCNNTLGILIIWGEGEFDYLGDFEYFWGDFFGGDALLKSSIYFL